MKSGLPATIFMVLLMSCVTQDICDENNHSELVVRFKTGTLDHPEDTIVSGVTAFGIREGQPKSLLYDSASVSRIILPMDPNHNESRFVMTVGDRSDTIGITHDNEAYLISYTCGFAMLFNIRNIYHTAHMITDVDLINAQVDAELLQDEEHIWIFF